tara:strand:- start:114 stop:1943 length:1830 start_codon:yes stop_codon:yes gene_type:complete
MSLEHFIKFIKDGEPVSPGTPNRPLQQLDQNIQYLWELIKAAELGSTVYARSQTVQSTIEVGQPVYLNSSTQIFEAAYATSETDTATGYLLTSESSQVWGIVAEKLHATTADILLFGYAAIDIKEAIATAELNSDGSVPAGLWYLSGKSVGKLTKQVPPVSVPVCKTDANGNVYVNPQFTDFLENHRHYAFDLEMLPAGTVTPPSVGAVHTITAADSSEPGWLPASDAIFDGNAPTGAKFGYNLSQNPDLNGVFPPIPLQSASITMQRPSVYDATGEHKWYGQTLMADLVVIDRNGIWWMSDCYDEVPWPTDYDSSSSASESYGDCDPAGSSYSMKLYYTRVNFATDNSTVSSLNSLDNRLTITCAGKDTPASTGHLDIDLDLSFLIGPTNVAGYNVFKSLDTTTGEFSSGPVAEGMYSASANVNLVGDDSTAAAGPSGETVYHGKIGISVDSAGETELSSQLVRLDGVQEQDYPVLYLGFPDDSLSNYVVKFEVPSTLTGTLNFVFKARVLGRVSGTLPPLTATYYKAAAASGLTPVSITQSYSAVTFDPTAATLASANQAVEVSSSSISVSAGEIIYVKLERDPDATADTYAGEVGVMQQIGVITVS